jgi:hypothetical protein
VNIERTTWATLTLIALAFAAYVLLDLFGAA